MNERHRWHRVRSLVDMTERGHHGTVTTLPRGRAFTRADLDAMPDDGRRYELIDGSLVVTPAPLRRHQRAVGNLHLLLRHACPPELEVLLAPFDVVLAVNTVVQPDLLVTRDPIRRSGTFPLRRCSLSRCSRPALATSTSA